MTQSPKTADVRTETRVLLEAAEIAWRELERSRPDLKPAIRLQRLLVGRQIEAAASLSETTLPPAPDPPRLTDKLSRGVPAFHHEPVKLPVAMLGPRVIEMCELLARGRYAREAAWRVKDALEDRRLDVEALLLASFARDAARIRTGAAQLGLAADVLWLAAELALAPFVWLLQRAWLGESDAPRVATWAHGYCPACGSWPALAEVVVATWGARCLLRCSFCGAAWQRAEGRCVYCDAEGATVRIEAPNPERAERRLILCDTCSAYLKWLAVPQTTPGLLLAVLDLATSNLDAAAAARGYGRPSLPDFSSSDGPARRPVGGGRV